MSRHGYHEGDCDDVGSFLRARNWNGVVGSASRGKRGQAFFRALVAALDAMPEKRLVKGELEDGEGSVCALGCLGKAKGVALKSIDTEDWETLGETFNIAKQLAQEVMFRNDEGDDFGMRMTPEERWQYVRRWAAHQIRVTPEELEQP